MQEYEYVDRPRGSAKDSINLAVDTLCTLGPGISPPPPPRDTQHTRPLYYSRNLISGLP